MNPTEVMEKKRMARRSLWTALAAALIAAAALAGCGGPANGSGNASSGGGGDKLSLVAYSTPQEAYQAEIPAFQKTAAGKGVDFSQSYGPSGDQSRAVAAGLPADIVALSLAPDVDKLVEPGIVDANWAKTPTKGFVTNSVVVLTVRKGNPKNIKTWADLVKPGVEVLTPNPFTSGGAKWNLMAAYGAQLKEGKSPAQALAYLKQLLQHVPVQDKSGRESLQSFTNGKGDVAITYENEAINAQQHDVPVDYVIPDQTILIQNPIATTKDAKPQAQAFVKFLESEQGQKIFASKGYRPVDKKVLDTKQFPTPKQLFTIDDLGGWTKVNDQFFDPTNGSVAKIEQDLGLSTAK
jgi:sulfate/thiosulfate transport system substrate-binding protein